MRTLRGTVAGLLVTLAMLSGSIALSAWWARGFVQHTNLSMNSLLGNNPLSSLLGGGSGTDTGSGSVSQSQIRSILNSGAGTGSEQSQINALLNGSGTGSSTSATSPADTQSQINAFLNDPSVKNFIGNDPALRSEITTALGGTAASTPAATPTPATVPAKAGATPPPVAKTPSSTGAATTATPFLASQKSGVTKELTVLIRDGLIAAVVLLAAGLLIHSDRPKVIRRVGRRLIFMGAFGLAFVWLIPEAALHVTSTSWVRSAAHGALNDGRPGYVLLGCLLGSGLALIVGGRIWAQLVGDGRQQGVAYPQGHLYHDCTGEAAQALHASADAMQPS